MNFITRNKGALLNLVFDTLNRKPVTNQEARDNFKDELMKYLNFLHRISCFDISQLNQKLYKQKIFLDKLDTLSQRYKSIGEEAIPEKNVEQFLMNIQEHMMHAADITEREILIPETIHFQNASSKLEMSSGTGLERKKSEAVDVLINSNRNRVNF